MILDYFDIRCGLLCIAHGRTVLQISGLVFGPVAPQVGGLVQVGKPVEVKVRRCLLTFLPKSSS